jgi:hypothetical protein
MHDGSKDFQLYRIKGSHYKEKGSTPLRVILTF